MRPEHEVRRADYGCGQDDEQDGEPRSGLTMVKPITRTASTSADKTSFSQRPRFTPGIQASICHQGRVFTLHALHDGTMRYEYSYYCCTTTVRVMLHVHVSVACRQIGAVGFGFLFFEKQTCSNKYLELPPARKPTNVEGTDPEGRS